MVSSSLVTFHLKAEYRAVEQGYVDEDLWNTTVTVVSLFR